MSALTPDLESAITFLDLLRSGGPWVLTAITPDGPTTTETFYKGEAAARWIERENATRNIYVMAAEATGALRKKATKDDVARTRHLWADIDSGGDLTSRLNGHVPPPTMIVASGGGLNVWWGLTSAIEDRIEIEARNRWLSDNLEADHCWNADRILRLPGTINWPNAKKKRDGRTPILARCVEYHPDRVYDRNDFGRSEAAEAKEGKGADLGDDIQLLTLEDLPAEVRRKLPAAARRLICEGPQPDEYRGDRSKAVYAVTCALVRVDASDTQIAGLLLNPELPIHAHVRDQKGHGPRAYVVRQIERARERVAEDAAEAEADPVPAAAEAQPWPEPLASEAYHGIVGQIVRMIEPETEADPAAILFQLLVAVGNMLGDSPFARVEADRHPPRMFVVQVGRTSKGRKGTSWGRVRSVIEAVDPTWAKTRIASGLSSGEGVIYEVRDPVEQEQTNKKGETETVIVDPGVTDKRLLLFEGEIAKALRSMERQGNTLSAVLRDAWDHGDLRTLIKNNPNRATGAHISLIGHITDDELRRYLDRTEMANGLANRLIFVCVQRSKILPRGGRPIDWTGIQFRLNLILARAPAGEIGRTNAAWEIWEEVYPALSSDRPGMLGAILGRAEAQVLRLALIYALLDGSAYIDTPHMLAALACWDYAEASARYIFGDTLGDPVADEILRALRERPEGMTRTDLMQHFARNLSSEQIGRALAVLARGNFAASMVEKATGRPTERWRATR